MELETHLNKLFDANRALWAAERQLLAQDPQEVEAVLVKAVQDAYGHTEPEEARLRLLRLADLCAQLPTSRTLDALLEILGHEDAAVRGEAGEALLHVAYERFKSVAKAIERALESSRRPLALEELPFILIQVHDPDPTGLILAFLQHPRAEVVAAAIEALSDYGNPAAIEAIAALVDDPREANLDDVDEGPTLVGDLARASLELLEADEPQ